MSGRAIRTFDASRNLPNPAPAGNPALVGSQFRIPEPNRRAGSVHRRRRSGPPATPPDRRVSLRREPLHPRRSGQSGRSRRPHRPDPRRRLRRLGRCRATPRRPPSPSSWRTPRSSRPSTPTRCSTIERGGRPSRSSTAGWPSSPGPSSPIRRTTVGEHDLLVLTGAEPDDRWQAFSAAVVELARRLGVAEWVSLGSIPAAVPHTRPVPIIGTTSEPGRLRGDVRPGPAGILRVPGGGGLRPGDGHGRGRHPGRRLLRPGPALRVRARIPAASVELLSALGRHLGRDPAVGRPGRGGPAVAQPPRHGDLARGDDAHVRRTARGDGRRGAAPVAATT